MKLLRVGNKGKEKPAVLDKNNKIRDLSSGIKDLTPDNLTHSTIEKLKSLDLTKLPELSNSERIGSCISNPGKFIAIGLNYSDHAEETGAKVPSEPIVFMKATSCINGPNEDNEIASDSIKPSRTSARLSTRVPISRWRAAILSSPAGTPRAASTRKSTLSVSSTLLSARRTICLFRSVLCRPWIPGVSTNIS